MKECIEYFVYILMTTTNFFYHTCKVLYQDHLYVSRAPSNQESFLLVIPLNCIEHHCKCHVLQIFRWL